MVVKKGTRLEASGTSEELSLINFLNKYIDYIDCEIDRGNIKYPVNSSIRQFLYHILSEYNILSTEIDSKTTNILTKLSNIDNRDITSINISLLPTITPNEPEPIINPALNNSNIKFEDFAKQWIKYRYSLCKRTSENPNPRHRTTIDDNNRCINNIILPFCSQNRILYFHQLTSEKMTELLRTIESYDVKRTTRIVLSLLFKYAISEKLITKYNNPIDLVPKPTKPAKTSEIEISHIKADDRKLYLEMYIKENTDMSLLFYTMQVLGLRPEEACRNKMETIKSRK